MKTVAKAQLFFVLRLLSCVWSRFHTVTIPTTVSLAALLVCKNSTNQVGRVSLLHSSPSGVALILQVHASATEAWVRCHLQNSSSTDYPMRGKHSCMLELFSKMPYIAEISERGEGEMQVQLFYKRQH